MLLSWEGQMNSSANSHPRWKTQGMLVNMLSHASASAWIFSPSLHRKGWAWLILIYISLLRVSSSGSLG